jgi:hypothetical protein
MFRIVAKHNNHQSIIVLGSFSHSEDFREKEKRTCCSFRFHSWIF